MSLFDGRGDGSIEGWEHISGEGRSKGSGEEPHNAGGFKAIFLQ